MGRPFLCPWGSQERIKDLLDKHCHVATTFNKTALYKLGLEALSVRFVGSTRIEKARCMLQQQCSTGKMPRSGPHLSLRLFEYLFGECCVTVCVRVLC